MWIVSLLGATASAQERGCDPLDEGEFRDLSVQLRAGIDRGVERLPGEVLDELRARIPCLVFVPTPQQWAEVLVGEAIVAYAGGGAWEAPMTTALQIAPRIDRGVSMRHPLATWEPPEVAPGAELGPEVELFVDGARSTTLPPTAGVHLVQRTDGRFYNSVLVVDQPLTEGFAGGRVVPPPHLAAGVGLDLLVAGGWIAQDPSWKSDWVQSVQSGDRSTVAPGLALDVITTFSSPFGVRANVRGYAWPTSPGAEVSGAGIWTFRGLVLGLGGGMVSVDTFEGPPAGSPLEASSGQTELHRVHLLRYPFGLVELHGGERWSWHIAGQSGGSLNCTRARAGFDLAAPPKERLGAGRWRAGLNYEVVSGRFVQDDVADHEVSARGGRVGVQIGRWWGEFR